MSAIFPVYDVDGMLVPVNYPRDDSRTARKYKPKKGDVFVVSYPKCGSTWMCQILLHIFQKGETLKNPLDYLTKAPNIDVKGIKGIENMQRPGVIKSHMLFDHIPKSEEAKYIYVARNPKDCCVSFYHFIKDLPGATFNGNFDEFFEIFMSEMSGTIYFGDYFEHLDSWYSHRNDPNVFVVTYEELKEDTDASILKIASFIDDEKYAEPMKQDPKILENVKKHTSVKTMKEYFLKSADEIHDVSQEELQKSSPKNILPIDEMTNSKAKRCLYDPTNIEQYYQYKAQNIVRKGIVGDWRNNLSEEQRCRLDEKFADKFHGTELLDLWMK